MKQKQIAKKTEENLEKAKMAMLKDQKRKKRHGEIRHTIDVQRQVQAERRKSIDREYNDYIGSKMRERQSEVS